MERACQKTLRIHVEPPSPIRYIDESRNQYHHVSKTFEDGSSYEGELLNYKFHGTGTYFFANGDQYEGSWNDGSDGVELIDQSHASLHEAGDCNPNQDSA